MAVRPIQSAGWPAARRSHVHYGYRSKRSAFFRFPLRTDARRRASRFFIPFRPALQRGGGPNTKPCTHSLPDSSEGLKRIPSASSDRVKHRSSHNLPAVFRTDGFELLEYRVRLRHLRPVHRNVLSVTNGAPRQKRNVRPGSRRCRPVQPAPTSAFLPSCVEACAGTAIGGRLRSGATAGVKLHVQV